MAGNQGNNRVIWQPWQIQFIKDNFDTMTAQQLADAIGFKRTKVRDMYYSLGLKKIEMEYWTDEQTQYLKDNWKLKGDTELAEIFNEKWHKNKGWSKKHIEKKRRYLKLKRTNEEMKNIHSRNVEKGYFAICPVNAWKTRGGASPEGDKRIWLIAGEPRMMIKVNGSYRHYARYLYEQTFGEIPKGYKVRIKDSDPYNIVIENLELVSDARNAFLNKTNRNNLQIKRQKIKAKLKYNIQSLEKITKEYEKQNKRFK